MTSDPHIVVNPAAPMNIVRAAGIRCHAGLLRAAPPATVGAFELPDTQIGGPYLAYSQQDAIAAAQRQQ
jgi:hypothetical protein